MSSAYCFKNQVFLRNPAFTCQNHTTLVLVIMVGWCVIFSGCATVNGRSDPWFGKDKLYHFTVAGVIGAGTSAVACNNGASEQEAPMIGLSVVLGLGTGKELYDKYIQHTYWSWKDMFWNVIGGTLGGIIGSRYD